MKPSNPSFSSLVAQSRQVLELCDEAAFAQLLAQNIAELGLVLDACESAWDSLIDEVKTWWLVGHPDRFSQICRAAALRREAEIAAIIRSELGSYAALRRTVFLIFSQRNTLGWQRLLSAKSKWSIELLLQTVREIWPQLVPETKSWWERPAKDGQSPHVQVYNAAVQDDELGMSPEDDQDDDEAEEGSQDDAD